MKADSAAQARTTDPPTSHAAADRSTRSGRRQSQRAIVWRLVLQHPDLTSAELSRIEGIDRYIAARRLPDLMRAGMVEQSGSRQCSVSGHSAVTWRVRRRG